MAQRNLIVSIHSEGSLFTCSNEGFSFCNTNVTMFKIHINSDYFHLKDRIEKKLQRYVEDIIYRQPLFNGDGNTVFHIMTPIKTDEDVRSMFQCHVTLSQLPNIEIYVRLVDNLEEQPSDNEDVEEQPTQNKKSERMSG